MCVRARRPVSPVNPWGPVPVYRGIKTPGEAIVGVDQPLLIHDRVVDLDRRARILRRRRLRDVEADLLDVRWRAGMPFRSLDGTEDAHAAVEPADRGVLESVVERPGEVRMQVVGAESAAALAQLAVVGVQRRRPDDDRMRFRPECRAATPASARPCSCPARPRRTPTPACAPNIG